jgi:hypothetical protein
LCAVPKSWSVAGNSPMAGPEYSFMVQKFFHKLGESDQFRFLVFT